MTILGFDTSGDELVVGLLVDSKMTIEKTSAKPHSRQLLPIIRKIVRNRKPDAIAVAVGPGSYTGTRVGVVTANTLGYSWKIPVYGVGKNEAPTIQALIMRGRDRWQRGEKSDRAQPSYQAVV